MLLELLLSTADQATLNFVYPSVSAPFSCTATVFPLIVRDIFHFFLSFLFWQLLLVFNIFATAAILVDDNVIAVVVIIACSCRDSCGCSISGFM